MYIRNNRRSRGFTLIELLVAFTIITLLTTIVLATVATARQKGRDAQRISDMRQIQIALQLYYEDNNQTYPTNVSAASVPNDLVPQYISAIPTDPLPNNNTTCRKNSTPLGGYCYSYYPSPSPTIYHLGAQLELSNTVLSTDADCRDSNSGSPIQYCPNAGAASPYPSGANSWFNGSDNVYDLIPK